MTPPESLGFDCARRCGIDLISIDPAIRQVLMNSCRTRFVNPRAAADRAHRPAAQGLRCEDDTGAGIAAEDVPRISIASRAGADRQGQRPV
jgi:hypothetical protein